MSHYPFNVRLELAEIRGTVQADRIRSLDWQSRQTGSLGVVSQTILREVMSKLKPLLA